MKKMKIKQILIAALTVTMIVAMTGCKTANDVKDKVQEGADKVEDAVEGDKDKTENDTANNNVQIDVTLTVEATDVAVSEYAVDFEEGMLDNEGMILSQTKYTVDEGTTVQDLIKKAMDEEKIPYSFKGTGADTTIEGIKGIMGGMAGETSGWVYTVNGDTATNPMMDQKLENGDDIRVYYRLDATQNEPTTTTDEMKDQAGTTTTSNA
jgi:predicted small secreted protein